MGRQVIMEMEGSKFCKISNLNRKSFKPMTFIKKTFKTIAMLAGGTGIAPVFHLLQAAHMNQDTTNFILLYSNKTKVNSLIK